MPGHCGTPTPSPTLASLGPTPPSLGPPPAHLEEAVPRWDIASSASEPEPKFSPPLRESDRGLPEGWLDGKSPDV